MKALFSVFMLLIGFAAAAQVENQTVKVGKQEWTAKNLAVKHFRNGDPIKIATNKQEWIDGNKNKEPMCAYYGYSENETGLLYNWFAVSDPRGLAPTGYHIPTEREWNTLIAFIQSQGDSLIGPSAKSQRGWTKGYNGKNTTGLNISPSGWVTYEGYTVDGPGYRIGNTNVPPYLMARYWLPEDCSYCASESGYCIDFKANTSYRSSVFVNIKEHGFAIRLIKD